MKNKFSDEPLDSPVLRVPQTAPSGDTKAPTSWRLWLKETDETSVIYSRRLLYFVLPERSRQSGHLTIEIKAQDRLKNGDWGIIKSTQLDAFSIEEFRSSSDREILGLLLSPLNLIRSGSQGVGDMQSNVEIDSTLLPHVMPALVASKRLFLNEHLLQWDLFQWNEREWDFEILVDVSRQGLLLRGLLTNQEVIKADPNTQQNKQQNTRLRFDQKLILLEAGYFIRGSLLGRVNFQKHFQLAKHLLTHSLLIEAADQNEFVLNIYQNSQLPKINLPHSLQWPIERLLPQGVAKIEMISDRKNRYQFKAVMRYGSSEIELKGPKKIILDPNQRRRIQRNLKAERAFISGLKGALSLDVLQEKGILEADLSLVFEELLSRAWTIEVNGKKLTSLSETNGHLEAREEGFALFLNFEFGGEAAPLEAVPLKSVIATYARGERFISIGAQALGFLSDEWLKLTDLMLRGAKFEVDGALRFSKTTLPLFQPVFKQFTHLKMDETSHKVFEGLQGLNEPKPASKPKELKATLRPYQESGLAWLNSIAASGFGGILADDMGLGKTIQVIAFLLGRATSNRLGPRPSLIVVPKSLVFNWLSEIEKFGPRLRILNFAGADRGVLKPHDYDVVVTTYHVLKNEIDRFAKIEFDSIILDEAQTIKNPGSQLAQTVYQLQGRHRFALTGTPIENSLQDLLSLIQFTNHGLIPKKVAASASSLESLAIALDPFILRRTKQQVLTELPEKSEQLLICEIEGEQKKLYDRLKKHYQASFKRDVGETKAGRKQIQVLEALLRMRQACCHPGLVDQDLKDRPSAKFIMLLEHLEEIRSAGHKALIFSQFTSVLSLLKPYLEEVGIKYEYLDGKTDNRGEVVNRFNSDSNTTAFLISLKAGGTGLNLTTASYVFLMDPWWNPAAEAQAIDRAYRMGQKQKVMAYRLIAKGTIEEKILKLQEQKRSLAGSVILDDQTFLRQLGIDDLLGLFE